MPNLTVQRLLLAAAAVWLLWPGPLLAAKPAGAETKAMERPACKDIKGAALRVDPKTGKEECRCPPETALTHYHETGWKCEECHVRLMHFIWWLNDRDWPRARLVVEEAAPCKWRDDGRKLLLLYRKSFGDD